MDDSGGVARVRTHPLVQVLRAAHGVGRPDVDGRRCTRARRWGEHWRLSEPGLEIAGEQYSAVFGGEPGATVDPVWAGVYPGHWPAGLLDHIWFVIRRLLHDLFEAGARRVRCHWRSVWRVQRRFRSIHARRPGHEFIDDDRNVFLLPAGHLSGRGVEVQPGVNGRPAHGILAGDGIEPAGHHPVLVPDFRRAGSGIPAAYTVQRLFGLSHVVCHVSSDNQQWRPARLEPGHESGGGGGYSVTDTTTDHLVRAAIRDGGADACV